MNVALDLAASRNADVASVASDLANAYVGNTKGLNQYRLGLTKAELAAMSFDEILEKIGSQTLGSADEAAKTLSGQLAILAEVSNQAKERIGGGLVQALGGLGGQNGAGGAAKNIENLSIKLTNAITGFGYLVQEVKIAQPILVGAGIAIGLAWAPWLTAIGVAAVAIGAIGNAMRKSNPPQPMNTGKLFFPSGGDGGYKERLAAEKKAEAAAAARAKKLEALAKASEKAQKDSLKLAKAKAVFDLQKIQIEAALKGKISEEDKIRLKLMKAIEDENITNVEKYQKALETAQTKTKELTELLTTVKTLELADPFGAWSVDPLTASINALTTSIGGIGTAITATGVEWSSFTGNIATTVLKPNLTEWSSSFSKATGEVTTALTTATNGIVKTATDASTALNTSLAAATSAVSKTTTDATASLLTTSKAAQSILGGLLIDGEQSLTDAATAATTDFSILATDTLTAVKNDLAAATAELAAAIAAAQAQAAADAADLAGAGTATGGTTKIDVTVTGDPFSDPNAVAEKVVEIIRGAGQRGTVDVSGID
jgi:hypothetical protein